MALLSRQPQPISYQQPALASETFPQALSIFCNGNYGVYLVARRGVQCSCKTCTDSRRSNPNSDCWLVSPTEFERHSGMSTAKKWRSSIRVAHEGEPDTTLGRWLDAKGLGHKMPAAKIPPSSTPPSDARPPAPVTTTAAAAAGHGVAWADQQQKSYHHQQQQQSNVDYGHVRPDQPLQDQISGSAQQLERLLVALQQQQQNGRANGDQSPCSAQGRLAASAAAHSNHNGASTAALRKSSMVHVMPSVPPSRRQHVSELPHLAAAGCESSLQAEHPMFSAAATEGGKSLGHKDSSNDPARWAAAAAAVKQQLQAGAIDGLAHVRPAGDAHRRQQQYPGNQQQQQQQEKRYDPATAAALAAAVTKAAAEAQAAAATASGRVYQHQQQEQQRSLRTTPQPAAAAAAVDAEEPVDLEQAAAAAARGDDSLWLRSPRRRTPKAVHLPPGSPSAAAAAGDGSSGQAAATVEALRRLLMQAGDNAPAAAAAAAVDTIKKDLQQQHQQQQGGDLDMNEAAGSGEEAEPLIGIAVGPQHQAVLPVVRDLPPVGARQAMIELAKAGRTGPTHAEAVAMAIEEKARADLLPRDAVEDVWQRTSGIALERAPRQRRAPGWQSGFIDPLKPYSLTGGPPGQQGGNQGNQMISNPMGGITTQDYNMQQGYPSGGRKRGNGSSSSGPDGWDYEQQQQQQQFGKRVRYNATANGSRGAAAVGGFNAFRVAFAGQRTSSDAAQQHDRMHPGFCCDDPRCPNTAAAAAAAAAGWATPLGPNGPSVGPELLSWFLVSPNEEQNGSPAAAAGFTESPAALKPGEGSAADQSPGSSPAAAAAAAMDPTPRASRASSEAPNPAAAAGSSAQVVATAPHSVMPDSTASAAAGPQSDVVRSASAVLDLRRDPTAAVVAAAADGTPAATASSPGSYGAQVASQVDAIDQTVSAPAETAAAVKIKAASSLPSAAAAAAAGSSPARTSGVVELRIVLDGCIYVGQLQEVRRVEMLRSRVPAVIDPIAKADMHVLPDLGAVCALCHAPESPGCHVDQATAVPSTGMSTKGLGPLMPVTMGLLPAAGAGQQQQQQQQYEVVWVHRQCALWSPEAYPDSRGMLMQLPMAITRGQATRCSRCGERGATLKCADRSCLQQFHLECARQAGCTLIADPYTVTCPAHEPQRSSPDHPTLPQQQQQQPNLGHDPKLRCKITRSNPFADGRPGNTPPSALAAAVAAARAAAGLDQDDLDQHWGPMFEPDRRDLDQRRDEGDRWGPMYDHYGSDSDLTPLAGPMFGGSGRALDDVIEEEDELSAAAVLLSGFEHNRPVQQSRLRYQSDDGGMYHHQQQQQHFYQQQHRRRYSANGDYQHLDSIPYHPAAAAAGLIRRRSSNGSRSRGFGSRSGAAAAAAAAAARNRASYGSQQMHDSRGRFMSHAAARAAQEAAASRAAAAAAARGDPAAAAAVMADVTTDSGGSPWAAITETMDSPAVTPAAADDAGSGLDLSGISDIPIVNGEVYLGGTTGQPGRAGRCAVCVVQRKGKCGTESAPKKCLRRMLQQQRRAQAAAVAAAAKQAAAGGVVDSVAAAAAAPAEGSNNGATSAAAASAPELRLEVEVPSPFSPAAAAAEPTAAAAPATSHAATGYQPLQQQQQQQAQHPFQLQQQQVQLQ